MKLVTGKINFSPAANKVSIQLALDGHSFSIAGGAENLRPGEGLIVEVLTDRTLLVPEALFVRERAALMLEADGKALRAGEKAVCSPLLEGMVAVMPVPLRALEQLRDRYGAGTPVTFTSPLLCALQTDKRSVLMQYVAGYLYIKIYHAKELQLAEVLPAPTDADVLYLFERLGSEFPHREYAVCATGPNAGDLARLASNYYRTIRCV